MEACQATRVSTPESNHPSSPGQAQDATRTTRGQAPARPDCAERLERTRSIPPEHKHPHGTDGLDASSGRTRPYLTRVPADTRQHLPDLDYPHDLMLDELRTRPNTPGPGHSDGPQCLTRVPACTPDQHHPATHTRTSC